MIISALLNKLNVDLPKFESIDDVIALANEDKGNMALIKTFWLKWAQQVDDIHARIKTLRSFYEWQSDLSDKLVYISWEMEEHSLKTEGYENTRQKLDPVFSDKFTENMAESVAANDQKF